ncbi:MAG: hypothetical protein K2X71_00430 [Methylobacterium sp.]|uniref:hypothetical protein n=1 Tax=Methylobacterium sp. TaxID=409 RepID=UPI002582B947|nr:hypothetical protein [Methylobacterium sp.]MBY0294502.1 hypothetical protein [Methylobacterium sp.]
MTRAARTEACSGWWDEHYIANCIGSQELIRRYLSPFETTTWELAGVTISAKKRGNRTGVPKSASTWVYSFECDEFSVTVRSVWNGGDLLGPLKTHTRVIKVMPDTEEARHSYNAWLRSIAAI